MITPAAWRQLILTIGIGKHAALALRSGIDQGDEYDRQFFYDPL